MVPVEDVLKVASKEVRLSSQILKILCAIVRTAKTRHACTLRPQHATGYFLSGERLTQVRRRVFKTGQLLQQIKASGALRCTCRSKSRVNFTAYRRREI